MDAEPATAGRHIETTGAPQLAAPTGRVSHLQVHTDVPRSYSNTFARNRQGAVAGHSTQTARSLPDVLVLREVHETVEIHASGIA